MQQIFAQRVPQAQDYRSPFDAYTPGFRDHWWSDTFANLVNPHHLPYSFTNTDGEEVARALLRTQAGFADLEDAGVALPETAIAVDLIEVREDLLHPRRGIGSQVVQQIETMHPYSVLFAFSEGADAFWRSTNWTLIPRRDGRTWHRPLFVFDRTGKVRVP